MTASLTFSDSIQIAARRKSAREDIPTTLATLKRIIEVG